MTKGDLAKALYMHRDFRRLKITKPDVIRIITSVFKCLRTGLLVDGYILIEGIGKIKIKDCKERLYFDPITKNVIPLKARKTLKFKPNARLKDEINGREHKRGRKKNK